jgi:hypothetical protein
MPCQVNLLHFHPLSPPIPATPTRSLTNRWRDRPIERIFPFNSSAEPARVD